MTLPVFKWNGLSAVNGRGLSLEMAELAQGGDAFFFARIPTTDVAGGMVLAGAGFRVIDAAITLQWAGQGVVARSDVSVALARLEQHVAVADIAQSCFRWTRFHLDPAISDDTANLVKRRWIANYCSGRRGAALYVAELDGAVAGFLAVLESSIGERRVAHIDLIGVAPASQGRGVGAALVRRFVDDWSGRVQQLRVGTQLANTGSIRFYEDNGFRAAESAYVLHAHYRDGKIST